MTINLRFTEEDWQRIERNWMAWWNHELERPLVMISGYELPDGAVLPEAPGFVSSLPQDMPVDEVVDRYQAHLEAECFYGDAFPRWWVNYGPGIMAGFLGARVHAVPETVWFEPAEEVEIHDLELAYDPDNAWWRRIRAITRCAAERWARQVAVGHTDLGGNLDILASFRTTQRLLLELFDAPEEVERLVGRITELWLRYYDELDAVIRQHGRGTTPWAPIWSPGRCYMLQSDFCYMLSPAMFERFVLPDLVACCEHLDHAFYHLDGKGEIVHLDRLLAIERLRGIQWIPGDGAPPPEEWLPLLKRIKDAGKLCQVFVSPDGARTIVRELGGRGFALAIQGTMERGEAEDFLKLLASEDVDRC